jgi:flavorubredoxin
MANVSEIAPDLYRISWFWPEINLQFNHFLLNDEEPLLFTTGFRRTFTELHEAVARVLDPSRIRWISFSHFESDECGALNQWLAAAPKAEPVCSFTGALVNVTDFANRRPRPLAEGDVLNTGKYHLRFCHTPHLPHGWDAGMLFEETRKTLLCSDLFHQVGDCEPLTQTDVVGRVKEALLQMNASPMPCYMPWCPYTGGLLEKLAQLRPETLAIMHGSSFTGDGEKAIRDVASVMKEILSDGKTE